jgi:tRNA uridine 5-carboxymethylaminomethyl modification enzyme
MTRHFPVIVIGGGHAGVEAAWAAANILRDHASVALVTQNPRTIGVMSCNPAIGGLAKGQMVREIDALNGLMGLAADATGIQFKVLNTSKGAAVHAPRAQCDKHAYARTVSAMIAARPEIRVIAGTVERLLVERGLVRGVQVATPDAGLITLGAASVVLTTGTFMRGLMHAGERRTPGGRFGEPPAHTIADALRALGFELGRLKTGTPPRLQRHTIRWDALEPQLGDDPPRPFSDLSAAGSPALGPTGAVPALARFPALPQVDCRITATSPRIHELIRANLHRAPMYSGQIESVGPRYCPSLEDKVVRFAQRDAHHVYLEPESLDDDWIYANGISTSLPPDVQDQIVRSLPGCENARILRYGYAVEYDMVRPHQITPSGQTRPVRGLFLAGQINGTSGYEEAAAQGLVAGLNAARAALGLPEHVLGRDEAYAGVLMDDLCTKTPVEPYRMFTSRAEHRLLLRADNAADRLTPLAERLGLLGDALYAPLRRGLFAHRRAQLEALNTAIDNARVGSRPLAELMRRPDFTIDDLVRLVGPWRGEATPPGCGGGRPTREGWRLDVLETVAADRYYALYLRRAMTELRRTRELEHRTIPDAIDYTLFPSLRSEARAALARFRPRTLGQAARLEGITPADVTLLSVLVSQWRRRHGQEPADTVPSGR